MPLLILHIPPVTSDYKRLRHFSDSPSPHLFKKLREIGGGWGNWSLSLYFEGNYQKANSCNKVNNYLLFHETTLVLNVFPLDPQWRYQDLFYRGLKFKLTFLPFPFPLLSWEVQNFIGIPRMPLRWNRLCPHSLQDPCIYGSDRHNIFYGLWSSQQLTRTLESKWNEIPRNKKLRTLVSIKFNSMDWLR